PLYLALAVWSAHDFPLRRNKTFAHLHHGKRRRKTYSSRDSHVVTHRSTNLPFNCLCMAERTGCPVFS
ncbi:hypothetical protein KCU67_g17835, partial [Aureobasidium melanogenum]